MFKKTMLVVLVLTLIAGVIGCDLITGEEEPEEEVDPWAGTSTITVNSDPSGANVYLEDSLTGQVTPCVLERCRYGESYDLKLTHSDFLDWETVVHIEGGLDHPVVDAVLITPDGSSVELEMKAELTRNGYGIRYSHKFNVEFMLGFFAYEWPEHKSYFAYKEIGYIPADLWYSTHEYASSTGERIPTGTHKIVLAGTDKITEQECIFEVDVLVMPGRVQSVKVRKIHSMPDEYTEMPKDMNKASVIVLSE